MLRVFVDGVVNCPGAHRYSGERKGCKISVLEIAAGQLEANLIPACYEAPHGSIDNEGTLRFPTTRFFHIFHRYMDDWSLRFIVHIPATCFKKSLVCQAEIAVKDLKRETEWCLLLENPSDLNHSPVYRDDTWWDYWEAHRKGSVFRKQGELPPTVRRPAFLCLRTKQVTNSPGRMLKGGSCARPTVVTDIIGEGKSDPLGLSPCTPGSGFPKPRGQKTRVMLLAKGTRGDVQPFVALARGLVQLGCECIIVTEICWKGFVKSARDGLPPGSLKFRPIGGNTMMVLRQKVSQWITWAGQNSDVLQTILFSLSEANFFAVEGCCYHWAYEDNPDFIVFPHTLVHIAMIISEALKIPLVGFVLQPMHRVEERGEFNSLIDALVHPVRKVFTSGTFLAALTHIMELSGGSSGNRLNKLRKSRGLHMYPSWRWEPTLFQYKELDDQGVHIFVPINPLICPEQVHETPEFTFTDFLFLRLGSDALDAEITSFVDIAHNEGRKVVTVAFSSMPVGEQSIVDMAIEIVTHCSTPVALIVMLAGQDFDPATPAQLEVLHQFVAAGLLLPVYTGVPFGTLFPLVDGLMSQGGLGVTSEALMAGIPVITSGVLLLDQRWWAARLHALGLGSVGVPITNLMDMTLSGKRRAVVLVDNMFAEPTAQRPQNTPCCGVSEAAPGEPRPTNLTKASAVSAPQAVESRPSANTNASSRPDASISTGRKGATNSMCWSARAKSFSRALRESRDPKSGDDGVLVNARAVLEAGTDKRVLKEAYRENIGCCGRTLRFVVWLARMFLLFFGLTIVVAISVLLYLLTEVIRELLSRVLRCMMATCCFCCKHDQKKALRYAEDRGILASPVGKADGYRSSMTREGGRTRMDSE